MRIDPKDISASTSGLDSMIREYSEQQLDAWRQIPYWAMKATFPENGEEKTIDNYLWRQMGTTPHDIFARIRAFKFGYWAVSWDHSANRYSIAVDLENGQLLGMYDLVQHNSPLKANPEQVLLLGRSIDELDAVRILQGFRTKSAQRHLSERFKEWQEKALLKYSLSPYGYVRP